jgi:hypothetical protein
MTVRWIAAGAVATAALTAMPAQAGVFDFIFGSSYDGRYGSYGYQGRQYTRSRGFDRGYRDGLKHGRKDGDKGRSFNVRRDDDFRDADNGYHREYGPRYEYARGYRDGYQEGYRRGYAEYGRGYGYYGGRGRDDGYGRGRYDERDGYYDRNGRWHPYDDRDRIYERRPY